MLQEFNKEQNIDLRSQFISKATINAINAIYAIYAEFQNVQNKRCHFHLAQNVF